MSYTHQGKVDFIHAVARRLLKANVPFEMKFYGQNRMTVSTESEEACMAAVEQEKRRVDAQLKMEPRETTVLTNRLPQDEIQAVIDEDEKRRVDFYSRTPVQRILPTDPDYAGFPPRTETGRIVEPFNPEPHQLPRYASGEGTQANVRKQNQDLVERDRQRWTCIPHGLLNCSACF